MIAALAAVTIAAGLVACRRDLPVRSIEAGTGPEAKIARPLRLSVLPVVRREDPLRLVVDLVEQPDWAAIGAEIDQQVVEIQERELKNLKTLAQTYSAMNPSAVVAIFRELDENMAVKVLSFMKADRVGPILGEMSKAVDAASGETMAKRAARITDKLRLLKPLKKETPA